MAVNKSNIQRLAAYATVYVACCACMTSATTITIAWLCTEAPVFIGFSAGTNLGALSYSLQEIESSTDSSSDLYGYTFE